MQADMYRFNPTEKENRATYIRSLGRDIIPIINTSIEILITTMIALNLNKG
jgi:hypothetical protein